ncbi:MAG: hypothetical protein ACAH95_08530 [Fimbriimonas sp.]
MPDIHLSEQVYRVAEQRAKMSGYASVEDYVSSLVAEEEIGGDFSCRRFSRKSMRLWPYAMREGV